MRDRVRAIGAALAGERQELGVLAGLGLLFAGLTWYGHLGAALIVTGAGLLWLHLPTRAPFVTRPPAEKDEA